jgi:hypothetical protein
MQYGFNRLSLIETNPFVLLCLPKKTWIDLWFVLSTQKLPLLYLYIIFQFVKHDYVKCTSAFKNVF